MIHTHDKYRDKGGIIRNFQTKWQKVCTIIKKNFIQIITIKSVKSKTLWTNFSLIFIED